MIDLEQMLRDTVPGGSSCDPQQIADGIRAWFAEHQEPSAYGHSAVGADRSAEALQAAPEAEATNIAAIRHTLMTGLAHNAAIAALDRIATPAQAQGEAGDWGQIEAAIDSYVEGYEMLGESEDGRDACYTLDADDRALLKDAIMGLLADDDFLKAYATPLPAQVQPAIQEKSCPNGTLNTSTPPLAPAGLAETPMLGAGSCEREGFASTDIAHTEAVGEPSYKHPGAVMGGRPYFGPVSTIVDGGLIPEELAVLIASPAPQPAEQVTDDWWRGWNAAVRAQVDAESAQPQAALHETGKGEA